MEQVEMNGYWYQYQHKLARHGVDTCLATKNPQEYCNGLYLFSSKDPGDGRAFVVVATTDPNVTITP
jgi:hypothetical protein